MTDLPARLRDAVKGVSKDDGFDYLVPAKDLAQTNALLTEAAERIEGLDEEYERTTDDQQATIDSLRAALDKVEAFAEEMMAGVRAVLESEAPALSRLRSVVRVVLSSMEAEPELSRVVLDFWSAGTFGARGSGEKPSIDFGTVYAQHRGLFDTLLEEAKREGSVRGDLPNDAPAVIVGAIEGVMLQWIVDPEAPSPLKMVEPMLEVLLDGLSKGGAGR